MAPPLDLTNPGDVFLYRTFGYRPDMWGNGTELVQFIIITFVIAGLNILFARRTGNPAKFMHLVTMTGIMEAVGYGFRIQTVESLSLTSYIITTVLILIAPIVLAGVNYVVIGKLLKASGKSMLCIKPSHATCFFVMADVLCFFIQASSAGLLTSKDQALQNAGTDVVLMGLSLQLFFFTCFVVIALHLAYSKKFAMMKIDRLRPVFLGLFLTSVCLYIRNVFRFVEFASGRNSQVVQYELVFFMFESSPIFASFIFYCLYHFGRLLPSDAELPLILQKTAESKPEMVGVEMQQI